MNRRYFLKLLATLSGVSMSCPSIASLPVSTRESNLRNTLDRFVTAYTQCVGQSIVCSGNYASEIEHLHQQLRICSEGDPDRLCETVESAIHRQCQSGEFWEVDGWVVTPVEALLSAVVVQDVVNWK